MYHLFFEQSGTFKGVLSELGFPSIDYDICDDFGKTDIVCDLFSEIEKAYDGSTGSVFDNIDRSDTVIAFFPCTRFESQISMAFRGQSYQFKNYSDLEKLKYSLKLHGELHRNYSVLVKLFILADCLGFKLIVENPYTQPHYLTQYFPLRPSVIDRDRQLNGDAFCKPTQYWFYNCEPKSNICFDMFDIPEFKDITKCRRVKDGNFARSKITCDYARYFLKTFVL